MINPNELEKAILTMLGADAELAALLPDGVYWDLAPIGADAFVSVSLSESRGLPEFGDVDTYRAFTYLVKAVARGTSSSPTAAADARLQALLDGALIPLPAAAGATMMIARWIDRVRYTETTAAAETWQHRGGRYEMTVTPT